MDETVKDGRKFVKFSGLFMFSAVIFSTIKSKNKDKDNKRPIVLKTIVLSTSMSYLCKFNMFLSF